MLTNYVKYIKQKLIIDFIKFLSIYKLIPYNLEAISGDQNVYLILEVSFR